MKLISSLKESRYMQYVASLTATLSVFSLSAFVVWGSPTLPKLTSDDSPIGTKLTDEEASWVASIFLLGCIPGGIMSAWMVEIMGRKNSLLFSAVPMFGAWILTAFAKSAMVLILVRFVAGIGGGIVMTVAPIYIGEIADKDIRGKLATAFNLLNISGSLFVFCVGPFVSYTALALSCSAFSVAFFILFYFMPESPYYLVKVDKKDLALKNLTRLSSKSTDTKMLEMRLNEIEITVEEDMKSKSSIWELLSKQEYKKGLIIIIGLRTLQQLSGVNAIDSYMQTIIEASSSTVETEISSIIFGAVQLPAVLLAALLVDKMGRKPLLIISALGCATALIGEGVYFYLQDAVHQNVDSISWLPTTGLALFVIMTPIGVMTLPYVLLAELFDTNIKNIAASIATFYGGLVAFLAIKFFKPVSEAFGMYTMFWFFAGICILGALFAFFVMPETKGKTFTEIQHKLSRGRRVQNAS